MKLKTRIFKGRTKDEVKIKAEKWISSFLRELKEFRKEWKDEHDLYTLEVLVEVKE